MSWFFATSSRSNSGLINNLTRENLIKTPFIKAAMLKVDRKHFLRLPETVPEAYVDSPLPLSDSVTISAPHMHAMAMEYLAPQFTKPNCKCLDVGSGSGYLVACMVQAILENHGNRVLDQQQVSVVGIEYLREIAEFSKQALRNDLDSSVGDEKIHSMYKIYHGDGWKGVPEYAPYDAIHVGAAAASIPQKLIDQLANGGTMVIPVGPESSLQYLCIVEKDDHGEVNIRKTTPVRYVPLINQSHEKGIPIAKHRGDARSIF